MEDRTQEKLAAAAVDDEGIALFYAHRDALAELERQGLIRVTIDGQQLDDVWGEAVDTGGASLYSEERPTRAVRRRYAAAQRKRKKKL